MTKKLNDIVGEAREQINELSRKTLGSYVKKAVADRSNTNSRLHYYAGLGEPYGEDDPLNRKFENRRKGINKAADKLAKEEIEQVDELSRKTLASYVKKASTSHSAKSGRLSYDAAMGYQHLPDEPINRKIKNRGKGIDRAVNKLTKEEADLKAPPKDFRKEWSKYRLQKHDARVKGFTLNTQKVDPKKKK